MLAKQLKRYRRHRRLRAKIKGTAKVPRLCVFRSAKHIYGQLIDDEKGRTLVAASDRKIKVLKNSKKTGKEKEGKVGRMGKIARSYEVGRLLAERALNNKIKKIVFDRGGYKYHGRVKTLAEGAREGGLRF